MFKHVLIPTDGSALADAAVTQGLAFAGEVGARVTLMLVVEPFHVLTADVTQIESLRAAYEAHSEAHAAEVLGKCAAQAKAAGVEARTLKVAHDQPFEAIVKTAAEQGCDLIAMASHGRRGLAAILLGSQTMKVLTHSKIPVLVYR